MEKKNNQISIQFNKQRKVIHPPVKSRREVGPAPKNPSLSLIHHHKNRKKNRWNHTGYIQQFIKRYAKHLKGSSKLFLTAGAAIGIGILLGLMVLSIFSNLEDGTYKLPGFQEGKVTEKDGEQDVPNDTEGGSLEGDVTDQDDISIIPADQSTDENVQIPARSYYVVQAGAFSDLGKAKELAQDHQAKGWAGILLEETSPYFLYIGLTSSKEDAILMGSFYQEQGVDIYVKEHFTAEVVQTKNNIDEEALQQLNSFLDKADQLVAKLSEVSASGIMSVEHHLGESDWNQLQELHRLLLQEGQQVAVKWPDEGEKGAERSVHFLTEGMNSLDEYRHQNHNSYLWNVQQALLKYMKHYEEWILSI